MKEPRVEISLLELLGILRIAVRHVEPSLSPEPKKRIANEFIFALNKGGHIDKKTLKDVFESINPDLFTKGTKGTKVLENYWWPE